MLIFFIAAHSAAKKNKIVTSAASPRMRNRPTARAVEGGRRVEDLAGFLELRIDEHHGCCKPVA